MEEESSHETDDFKDENGESNSRKLKRGTYTDHKDKNKQSIHRQLQIGKNSIHSSYSKLATPLKGQSSPQTSNIRGSESISIHKLVEKYGPNDTTPERIKEQMQLALQRKNSEIQALRVQRDQLRFISYNSQYDTPIKMGLAVLKQKAKTEEKMKDMIQLLQKDRREIQLEFNCMTDYYNYLIKAIKSKEEEDLMIDPQQEEKLMMDNLQKETAYLLRELKEQDKRNARQIRSMQEEIANFRIMIKQKEDRISELKSKICTLHIKLHNRVGSISRHKNISFSIRNFITDNNKSIQEVFIGNGNFKHYSKELLEKINKSQELIKIIFYFDSKKELLTFRCIYKNTEGIIHSFNEEPFGTVNSPVSPPKSSKDQQIITELIVKQLLSIKFYFKSKIVGLECRLKSQKGMQRAQIDKVTQLQHQLLTLINKRVVTLGSYWYQKDMIGVGVWYCSRPSNVDSSKQLNKAEIRTVKSAKKPIKNQVISEYYMA